MQFGKFGKEARMNKVEGNLDSIKKATVEYAQSFIGETFSPGEFIPEEVISMMKRVTVESGRECAVCLDRRNTVISVNIGDARGVGIGDTPTRGGKSGLCGVRNLHTHPNGVPLPSKIDLNTLSDARLDAMVVVGIDREKQTVKGLSASVLGRASDGSLEFYETVGPYPPSERGKFDALFEHILYLDKTAGQAELIENSDETEKAILVGVTLASDSGDDDLAELAELARAAGAQVVGTFTQRRESPDSKFYIGSGLVATVSEEVKRSRADVVIFDDELSPSQIRNLEEKCGVRIIDRTALILDIFARRATSREGRLQVELAQQKYRLPRLTGLGTVLSRLGGGIGTRGPGETKLQTDKRHIMRKIHYLENELEEVERRRALLRGDRKRREIPTVSLVGYTNSGKSTMLNALCGSDVYVQNQLFATLDPSVRRMETDSERDILLVDTVGFIKKLPHELVEAFKSTLEEAVSSDLLIHVVDMGCDDFRERIAIVEGILADIGATEGERFLVLNKADLLPPDFAPGEISGYSRVFLTSATEGTGLEMLREGIISHFAKSLIMFDFVLPYSDGTMLAFLHENGTVTSEEYLADGIRLAGSISDKFAQKLGKYL